MTSEPDDGEALPEPGLHGLSGKTVVVTGSTRGIGRGIARRFAGEGANVVVTGRTVDAGERIAAEIRDGGGEATFVRADMADPDDLERLIDAAADEYETIDIVINNAAAWRHEPADEQTVDDWGLVMNVSLRAPWLVAKLALDHMPPGGSVINVSSAHGVSTDPGRFPYNVAKAGLNGLTRAMAIDFGSHDVRVNGLIVGDIVKEYSDEDPLDEEHWNARIQPVNRRGTPADVAGIATFLASEEAGFITGANIPVDGGRLVCLARSGWPGDGSTS